MVKFQRIIRKDATQEQRDAWNVYGFTGHMLSIDEPLDLDQIIHSMQKYCLDYPEDSPDCQTLERAVAKACRDLAGLIESGFAVVSATR